MKRALLCGVMALVAASAALGAFAQPQPSTRPAPGSGGPGSGGGAAPGRPGPGNPGGGRPGGGNRPNPGGPGVQPPRPGGPGVKPPGPQPPRPQPPQGGRPPPPHRPPNRPIYGWNGHRYRAGPYSYPAGYAYRRWTNGQLLPLLFLSSAYYFTNYAVLGLDPPPYGYQWVRYGPDVILVNTRTGQIMDVVYGVFY